MKKRIPEEKPQQEMFVHSRCCMAHWELVVRDGVWGLECEECGTPTNDITVIGPNIEGCHCEECGEE